MNAALNPITRKALERMVFFCLIVVGAVQAQELGPPPVAPAGDTVEFSEGRPKADAVQSRAASTGWIDTANREAVRSFYNSVFVPSNNVAIGWTGSITGCVAGNTAAAYKDAVALRVNWFRSMSGVPAAVTLNDVFNTKDQAGALMLSANKALSHTPPANWLCYTAEGAEATSHSNICIATGAFSDPGCIALYVRDHGAGNTAAGHRRWILYPQTNVMGTGDVAQTGSSSSPYPFANALWVIPASSAPRPATRDEFVAWPPKGFVPYQIVYPRWSFSMPNANFTSATVTMLRGGQFMPVRLEAVQNGYGENTIVWVPNNLDADSSSTNWPAPGSDTTIDVSILNVVVGGTPRNITYSVTIFDPSQSGGGATGTVSLDGTDVWFGATQNGATVTAPQRIQVTATAGLSWSVSSDQPYIVVSPSSGSGNGSFNVSVNSSSLPSTANLSGVITVTAPGASNSPQTVRWHVNVMNPSSTAAPFGSFDTPANNATGITGSLGVTGWVLDDVEVTKVQIWRDPVGAEPVVGNGLVFIGDATFVRGARPDVASLYPTLPLSDRAGWGYLMLTNMLPNSSGGGPTGNGTYKLHAIAIDRDGHTVELGTKMISCNNAQAAKPFGAIDTPGQGETVSGTIINFGWALTQQPGFIRTDGSTIVVMMDGQVLGHPVYNQYRADIANLFPGYANSNGAVGYFYIDTTQFSNGLHNLSWVVTDNAGRTDGIGSRYITIFN